MQQQEQRARVLFGQQHLRVAPCPRLPKAAGSVIARTSYKQATRIPDFVTHALLRRLPRNAMRGVDGNENCTRLVPSTCGDWVLREPSPDCNRLLVYQHVFVWKPCVGVYVHACRVDSSSRWCV